MDEALVVFVRGIISFFTLLIFTRILGKQQIGEITFFDYILGITIGSFAASLTVDLGSAAWPHWVGLLTWITLGVAMQLLSLKFHKVAQYINDKPIIVIKDGKIIKDNLKSTKFTFSELLSQLRLKGVFELQKIKYAMIEINGQFSVIGCEQYENMLKAMNISIGEVEADNVIIFNGVLIEDSLLKSKGGEGWVLEQLRIEGFENCSQIAFAYLGSSNKLIVIPFNMK